MTEQIKKTLTTEIDDIGKRLDIFLSETEEELTRSQAQKLLQDGFVLVNGIAVAKNYKLRRDDTVTLTYPAPVPCRAEAEDIPIDIVYEDDDIIVVNKPKGMVVHPAAGNYTGTLVSALLYHCGERLSAIGGVVRPGIVHRIDKDTSGLLVVAKTAMAKTHLGIQFFNKTTKREYNALVWGSFSEDSGRIEGNIARHPKDRMQMAVFPPDSEIGKHAVTHYEVLERFGYVTLVRCVLETGRTHQIRVHMKHIGHTLFNDSRYGGEQILRGTKFSKYKQFVENCFKICPRQALHAKTLGFVHPRTGEEMMFSSEIPSDMSALFEKWRNYMKTEEV